MIEAELCSRGLQPAFAFGTLCPEAGAERGLKPATTFLIRRLTEIHEKFGLARISHGFRFVFGIIRVIAGCWGCCPNAEVCNFPLLSEGGKPRPQENIAKPPLERPGW